MLLLHQIYINQHLLPLCRSLPRLSIADLSSAERFARRFAAYRRVRICRVTIGTRARLPMMSGASCVRSVSS